MCNQNHKLRDFRLKLPPAPRGVPKIQVTFSRDDQGMLVVKAVDKANGNIQEVKIDVESCQLSQADISKMIEDNKNNFQ